jgi:hypothetical protein
MEENDPHIVFERGPREGSGVAVFEAMVLLISLTGETVSESNMRVIPVKALHALKH